MKRLRAFTHEVGELELGRFRRPGTCKILPPSRRLVVILNNHHELQRHPRAALLRDLLVPCAQPMLRLRSSLLLLERYVARL